MTRGLGTAAIVGLMLSTSAQAENILYCNDYNLSTDRMGMALDGFESTHSITRTTSLGSCDSMISGGGWDLVIYAVQNWSHESYALNSYVSSGGMAIMQDWTSNGGRASAFGISWSSTNYSSMNITDSRLSADLWTTSVSLSNPGWGIYSVSFSVGSGEILATSAYGNAAIGLTNGGRTIVNGNLTDTISDVSLGVQIYTNEINILLGGCDADDDGYERPSCGGTDCDDDDPWVNPAAIEIPYDGVDNDCDGADMSDVDGDGFDWDGVGGTDCDDGDASIHSDAVEIPYDGVDNDCDGADLSDADGDGHDWVGVGGDDCAETDETVHPGVATETPDGVDEDCDGDAFVHIC